MDVVDTVRKVSTIISRFEEHLYHLQGDPHDDEGNQKRFELHEQALKDIQVAVGVQLLVCNGCGAEYFEPRSLCPRGYCKDGCHDEQA